MAQDDERDESEPGEPVSGAAAPEPDPDTDTDTDTDTERLTPEVVAPGVESGGPPPLPGPNEKVQLYRMVRIGISVLLVIGIVTAGLIGLATVASPDSAVCTAARRAIEDELDQDEPAEAVRGIDPDTVDDIPCEEAVPTAQAVDDSLIDESAARTLGIAATILGALMVGGGVYALVTRTRRGRTVALVAAGVGLLAGMVGLGIPYISPLALAFAIYAMAFSRDARASYGDSRAAGGAAPRPSLFRPRLPPPSPKDE